MMRNPLAMSWLLVMVLAGYVGYRTIYQTHQQRWQALQARMADEQQTQTLRAQVARVVAEVEQFRKRLPPEPEPGWLVQEVTRLADEAGVQLATIAPISPRTIEGLDGCVVLAVTVNFAASYHQLGTFVSALEHAPVFLRIDELQLARSGEGMANIELTVGSVYVPSLSVQPVAG